MVVFIEALLMVLIILGIFVVVKDNILPEKSSGLKTMLKQLSFSIIFLFVVMLFLGTIEIDHARYMSDMYKKDIVRISSEIRYIKNNFVKKVPFKECKKYCK